MASRYQGLAAVACCRHVFRPRYDLILESPVQHDELSVIASDLYDEVSVFLWVLLGLFERFGRDDIELYLPPSEMVEGQGQVGELLQVLPPECGDGT